MWRAGACAALLALLPPAGAAAEPAAAEEHAPPPGTQDPADAWTGFFHGYAFLVSNRQGGPSGARDFESVSHIMTGLSRGWWGGTLSLLGTFTLEPATIPPEGSPLLFQRGETYRGALLVDRQHPHDLFVQLAAEWRRLIADGTALRVTLAPWGEPAVGPTAYPHRLSASADPSAPLAHHNQDSTHISANVITASLDASRVTLEGSLFHGGEPDENRWNIDPGPIDSYSGRLVVRPGGGFSFQVSAARREHPETIEPGDETRQTASIEFERRTKDGLVAVSLIAGRNLLAEGVEWGNGLEGLVKFGGRNTIYGRIESVDRDRFELINKRQRPDTVPPSRTNVKAATFGFMRDVPLLHEAATGLGADLTFYRFDAALDDAYGSDPLSLKVFLRFGFGSHGGAPGGHVHH